MPGLAEYAALVQLLSPALPQQGRRIIALNELWLVATLLSVVGFIAILVGLFLWLDNHYPREIALLVIGGIMVAVSLMLVGISLFITRRVERPVRDMADNLAHNSTDFIKSLIDELDDPIRENPAMAMGVAALSGFIAAEKMM